MTKPRREQATVAQLPPPAEPPLPRMLKTATLDTVTALTPARTTSEAALPVWRGMLAALVGAGESGKTWIAAHAVLDVITTGRNALVLDGEMAASTWRRRLEALGATTDQLSHVHYVELTEDSTHVELVRATWRHHATELLVWDSALSMIARTAQSENDNAAVSRVYDRLRDIVRNGPAGLIVDHVAAGAATLVSRGATAKFNALDVAYGVRIADASIPGPIDPWSSLISVEKDRHGLLGNRTDREASFFPIGVGGLDLSITTRDTASHRLSPDNPVTKQLERIAELDPPPTSANDALRQLGGNRRATQTAYRLWKDQQS